MLEAFLIHMVASVGVPERFRRIAGYAFAIAAVVALLWAGKALYDRSVIASHEADKAADSIEARDVAASQRATDTIANAEQERQRNEAINTAPTGQPPSAPARALACERLRQLGRISPNCGPANSDGGKAGAR